MKINEIIRERRLKKGLTQAQVAKYLGVSTPAVNKWEKGTTYPDLVLLPALARLLDTDLNTLLSFQEDLSEKEVALFMNEVLEQIDRNGFDAGYSLAVEKLREYPNSDLLVSNLAALLDGAIILSGNPIPLKEKYGKEIEALYQRAAQSADAEIRERAAICLISKLMEQGKYEQAQELLDTIPERSSTDRGQMQANIWIEQGELKKAEKRTEEKLLSVMNELHSALMTLMEIAIKEERMDDAGYIADVAKGSAQLFDLWEYNSYIAHFQLYIAEKDREKAWNVLRKMFAALTKKWEIDQSPLYRLIEKKEVSQAFGEKFQKLIIESIRTDEEMQFLKDSPEWDKWMKEINSK